MHPRLCLAALLSVLVVRVALADDTQVYHAADTLNVGKVETDAARAALAQLTWAPRKFDVCVGPVDEDDLDAKALVTFASPRPSGDPALPYNTVYMEWFAAQFPARTHEPARHPAVVILPILNGDMILARGVARGLAQRGIDAFVMQMPGYGRREGDKPWNDASTIFQRWKQSIADARRARDAIAALPPIDPARISIQGTSLGAFIATVAAALDAGFDNAFLVLSGGHLYDLFHNGQREAQWIRQAMLRAGIDDDTLKRECDLLDPLNLADRLPAKSTYLISASADQVIPRANSDALAAAAHLSGEHRRILTGDHYTILLYLPWEVRRMADEIHADSKPSP
ncbi:MAG: hypothetical protein GC162_00020 [Planctomycetes bacterium]|nr:hypothetical protein [Planctomycetota bacterium]